MRSSYRRITFVFAAVLAAVMVALLVGPRVRDADQRAHCVVNVHLGGPFGLSLNCDSPEFMRLAVAPQHLFDPNNERQSRPGLIAAAALVALPLSPLAAAAQSLKPDQRRQDIDPARASNALATYPPAFVAYVLLNALLVVAAFQLVLRAAASQRVFDATAAGAALVVGLLLIGNDVVKVFVWSPHTQMFNILVPILAVYVALRAGGTEPMPRSHAVLLGLLTGWGITAYALFFVVVPCYLAAALWRAWRDSGAEWRKESVDAALFCLAAGAPFAIWYAVVLAITGSFYQHEIALGQVTWMRSVYDAQGTTALVVRWFQHFGTLTGMAAVQGLALAAVVAWIAIIAATRGKLAEVAAHAAPALVAALLVFLMIGGFYSSTGLIAPRLAYALIPPFVVVVAFAAMALARLLQARERRVLVGGIALISAVQIGAMIWKYPPPW